MHFDKGTFETAFKKIMGRDASEDPNPIVKNYLKNPDRRENQTALKRYIGYGLEESAAVELSNELGKRRKRVAKK